MNLRDAILEEHSKAQTNKIVNHIGNDKLRFDELMNLFFGNEYRVTQRAAWALGNCTEKHPELIKPYLKKLVDNLQRPKLHDAVKRNSLRLLQFIDIPKKLQGKLIDRCFSYILSRDENIAIKVFSLAVIHKISKTEPDLKNELRIVINDLVQHDNSPGIQARCRNILKDLDKK